MAGIKGQPEPAPQDAGQPVPGKSALSAYADAAPAQAQTTGKSVSALDKYAESSTATPTATDQPGMGSQALDIGIRALDYPGGIMRTTLGGAAGALTSKEPIVSEEDIGNTLKGKAPNSAEYLRRLGVSEGGSLSLPGLGKVTLRGAEGLALDIVTDPLTLVAKAVREIPYLSKLMEAPGRATEALGDAVYSSAITAKNGEKADKAAKALIEAGATIGGEATLNAKISQTADTMGKMRQALYDRFNQAGAAVDVSAPDAYKSAQGMATTLLNSKREVDQMLGQKFQEFINTYKGAGYVPIEEVSRWKTELYDQLPKAAFQEGGKITNQGKALKAALAIDFKNLIVDSGNKVDKGLGDAINTINDKWGSLLEASSIKGGPTARGNVGRMIDGLALAAGGVPGYMKKKAFDMVTGPAGRTAVGKALMSAGSKAYMNSLTLGKNAAMDSQGSGGSDQQDIQEIK